MSDINISTTSTGDAGFVAGVNANEETAKTAGKKRKHHVGGQDSTSQASGAETPAIIGFDAGKPTLVNPSNLTDAQMIELIGNALSKSNRQRRVTQDTNQDLTTKSKFETTQVVVTPDQENTSSSDGSSSSTSASASANAGNTSASASASTSSSSSAQTSTTVTIASAQAYTALTSALSSALDEKLEKQLRKKLPHHTFNQIQDFLNSLVQSAQISLILPALGTLGKVNGSMFRTDKGAVDTATSVQFGIEIQKAIENGDVKNLADSISTDKVSASQLASILETILVQAANIQVGNALQLPGFSNQVNAQAAVVRDQQTAYSKNGDQVASNVVDRLIRDGVISADLKVQTQAKLAAAFKDTTGGGPYSTREDLQAALKSNVAKQFPDNADLATLVVTGADEESFALATDGKTVYLPTFDPDSINVDKVQESIKQGILEAFAKSDEEVNASAKAKAIVDDILARNLVSRYRSEQDLRDDIKSALRNELSSVDITDDQVDQIAARVDFGIPPDPANPLYDDKNTAIIAPWVYQGTIETAYQNAVHVAPSSDLGTDLNQLAGVARGLTGISSTQLLNEAHASASTETRNVLNLTPDEAAAVARNEFTDPAALVKNLGDLMNSPHLPSNFQQARFV